eukprot:1513958-Rhodomonas_salina.2
MLELRCSVKSSVCGPVKQECREIDSSVPHLVICSHLQRCIAASHPSVAQRGREPTSARCRPAQASGSQQAGHQHYGHTHTQKVLDCVHDNGTTKKRRRKITVHPADRPPIGHLVVLSKRREHFAPADPVAKLVAQYPSARRSTSGSTVHHASTSHRKPKTKNPYTQTQNQKAESQTGGENKDLSREVRAGVAPVSVAHWPWYQDAPAQYRTSRSACVGQYRTRPALVSIGHPVAHAKGSSGSA